MAKRILSLLAVTCMLLTVFVACGKEPATSSDVTSSGDSTPDVSTSVSDVSDTPAGDENPDNTTTTNVSGNKTTTTTKKKDTSSGNKAGYEMPFDKPVTFTLYLNEHASQPIKADSVKWSVITEMTNVTLDVDIGSGTTATTKLAAASASGKMYDITAVNYSQLRNLKSSLFMDLTNVIKTKTPNYYNLVKNEKDLNLYKVDGKNLGFAMYVYDFMDTPKETGPMTMAIRKDILDKHNLKVPTTWQEWFTTMKTLKSYYPDSTPYSGRMLEYILDYWTESLGGQKYKLHYNSVEGKYVAGVLQSNFRSVLQFMNSCYKEGILDPDFDTPSPAKFLEGATSNKVFFWIDNGVNKYTQNNALQEVDKNAAFMAMNLMPSHLNNNKKTGSAYTLSTEFQLQYCLSSQAEHPEELLAFMDWCYTEEGMLVNSCGKEGVTYEMDKNGEPYLPEKVWKKYIDNAMPEYAWMSDLGLGQLCFAPRLLSNAGIEWKGRTEKLEETDPTYSEKTFEQDLKNGCYVTLHSLAPDVDADMQNRFSQINTYLRTQVVKFIKGDRPLSEYNSFLNELNKLGIQDILKACNSNL